MKRIVIDFETRSHADLKKVGAWAYSQHPTTELICACWVVDDGPVESFLPLSQGGFNRFPPALRMAEPFVIEAHNAAFEYSIWHNVCAKKYGWPVPPDDVWRDSMAVACYYALPASLDALCKALGLEGKLGEGKHLIQKYSKLFLKHAKTYIPPEDLALWVKYCSSDVAKERHVSSLLGDLPAAEEQYFIHDFLVGARGINLDIKGVTAAQNVVDLRAEELVKSFRDITEVNPTQRDAFISWLKDEQVSLPNMQADTIDELLSDGTVGGEPLKISKKVRAALEIRRQHARTSGKKLTAMLRQKGSDGRARFQTRYHGAATGRNTGTGFQPLNMNRGYDRVDPEQLVRDINYGSPKWLDAIYGDAMEAVGASVRHWIQAPPGYRIMAGDFASIEAIVLACMAGETWKIERFRQKDPRIYEIAAERIHGLPEGTVTKATHPHERQDGKTGELAFGYRGALGAWRKFDSSDRHSDQAVLGFVRKWRADNPNIVSYWDEAEDCAISAVLNPHREFAGRSFSCEMVDSWLTAVLPDGKRIWYFQPQIRDLWPHWHNVKENEDCAAGVCDCRKVPTLTYMSVKEGHWKRVKTYSGKLVENWTQAASRQILKPIELRAEAAGYRQILGVYDEIVCEVPVGYGSIQEFRELIEAPAGGWCNSWPIKAEVWEGDRYKK